MILDKVRIDKYLHSIRLFKTRTIASDACDSGKVRISGDSIKASRNVKIGEEISVRMELYTKTIKIIRLIEKRVGAEIAVLCYEDITPEDAKPTAKSPFLPSVFERDRGAGRPTKRDRREIEEYRGED